MNESQPPELVEEPLEMILRLHQKTYRKFRWIGSGLVVSGVLGNLIFWASVWSGGNPDILGSVSSMLGALLVSMLVPISAYVSIATLKNTPRKLRRVMEDPAEIIWVFETHMPRNKPGVAPIIQLTLMTRKGATFFLQGTAEEIDRCRTWLEEQSPNAYIGYPHAWSKGSLYRQREFFISFNAKQLAKEIQALQEEEDALHAQYYLTNPGGPFRTQP